MSSLFHSSVCSCSHQTYFSVIDRSKQDHTFAKLLF